MDAGRRYQGANTGTDRTIGSWSISGLCIQETMWLNTEQREASCMGIPIFPRTHQKYLTRSRPRPSLSSAVCTLQEAVREKNLEDRRVLSLFRCCSRDQMWGFLVMLGFARSSKLILCRAPPGMAAPGRPQCLVLRTSVKALMVSGRTCSARFLFLFFVVGL